MEKKIDLVIARYNENLDWLNEYSDKKFNRIFVYNKGKTDVVCPIKPVKGEVTYEKLENVGRCDHTYIYHIMKNYDDLGDVTFFIKGSVICKNRGMQREPEKFKLTLDKIFETGDSVFLGKRYPPDLAKSIGDIGFNNYVAHCSVNVNSSTKANLHPANPNTFTEWYKARFPNVKGESRVCYAGIFAVSREHIRQRKKEDYKPFLDDLAVDSNPKAGHFMERAWLALFYRIPDECFYETLTPWQGGYKKRRRSTRKKIKKRMK